MTTPTQTRSGKAFASWTGPHVTVPNPTFDFEELFQEALERAESGDSEDEFAQQYNSGPEDTPEPQPSETPLRSSSPDPPLCAKDRRRIHKKSQSHSNRDKKRQKIRNESFSHHEPNPRIRQKYILTANPIATPMSTADSPVAKNAYIGIDDRLRSQTVHKLEDLVGPESRYKFQLQTWDGR